MSNLNIIAGKIRMRLGDVNLPYFLVRTPLFTLREHRFRLLIGLTRHCSLIGPGNLLIGIWGAGYPLQLTMQSIDCITS